MQISALSPESPLRIYETGWSLKDKPEFFSQVRFSFFLSEENNKETLSKLQQALEEKARNLGLITPGDTGGWYYFDATKAPSSSSYPEHTFERYRLGAFFRDSTGHFAISLANPSLHWDSAEIGMIYLPGYSGKASDYHILIHYRPIVPTEKLNEFCVFVEKQLLEIRVPLEESTGAFIQVLNASKFGDVDFEHMPIKKVEIDWTLNYSSLDREAYHKLREFCLKPLSARDGALAILHGPPGTGKTMLLRQLVADLGSNASVIYIPHSSWESLDGPQFVKLLKDKKNPVLLLEEAQTALEDRATTNRGSAVASLLNYTSGFMGDIIPLKIICTLNVDEKYIDKALLRPGRLAIKHEFKPLPKEQAVKLAEKLGLSTTWIDKDPTLAEIYNEGYDPYSDSIKKPFL